MSANIVLFEVKFCVLMFIGSQKDVRLYVLLQKMAKNYNVIICMFTM